MTTQSPRKSLVQLSGGCLVIAVISAIMGLIIGQYGIAFYVAAVAALILSFVVFYFARKYPENTKASADPKVSGETRISEEPAEEK
ncbi:MAG TPA: hypothetical protein O0X27_04510 [Methanocorpusculum sp.]|nr:hypothetical protein [Methanocorpusculum sp.]